MKPFALAFAISCALAMPLSVHAAPAATTTAA
jgi:hypothetical protein